MGKLDQAVKNRAEVARIKRLYDAGVITRHQAKMLAQPILGVINETTVRKTAELNHKYGLRQSPALLSFISAMRNEY